MPPGNSLMVTDTQTLHTNTHAHACTFMLSAASLCQHDPP